MRFTAAQMRDLHAVFASNVPGTVLGDHVTMLSRWLHHGAGGHVILPEHWTRDGALLLYRLIRLTMKLRNGRRFVRRLTQAQQQAYRRRLEWLETEFGLHAVDILGATADL